MTDDKRSGSDRREGAGGAGRRGEPRISLKTGELLPDRRQRKRRQETPEGDGKG